LFCNISTILSKVYGHQPVLSIPSHVPPLNLKTPCLIPQLNSK
jgi:hypothetical protein